MSVNEIPENDGSFAENKNVRISIAGLSICKFANKNSEIRFLRHVPKHRLKMKIIQKKADNLSLVGSLEYEIGANLKEINISGGIAPVPPTFEHKPTSYREYALSKLANFSLLHGHKLDYRTPLPLISEIYRDTLQPTRENNTERIESPTLLKIDYCKFYTAKMTENKYNFKSSTNEIIPHRDFLGEILGGYMTVSENENAPLVIYIPGFICPRIELPMTKDNVKYVYEIQFNNSCFTEGGETCKDSNTSETDFRRFYDILIDNTEPKETFDLQKIDDLQKIESSLFSSTGTGACIPGCESC